MSSATTKRSIEGTRGHARDPLEEEFPYLSIGPSTYSGQGESSAPIFQEESADSPGPVLESDEPVPIVSESPGAAEFDIYDTAYRQELERIQASLTDRHAGPKVYLTRRVEGRDEVLKLAKEKALDLQIGEKRAYPSSLSAPVTLHSAASVLRNQLSQKKQTEDASGNTEHTPSPERPPPSSLSSQTLPHPEASSLEATGTPADAHVGADNSKAQLRRLLGRWQGGQ